MYAIKAIYDGSIFKIKQPIPVKENYEVIITFVEPIMKEQTGIMNFFNCWYGNELLDLEEIMIDRKKISVGRIHDDDIS